MKIGRVSVGGLMAAVGLAALNLAASRRLAESDERLALGVMPAALGLQLALYRLVRTRGRGRAFWAGFLAAGLPATLSFVGAHRLSGSVYPVTDLVTHKMVFVVIPGSYGGDRMYEIWIGYGNVVARCFPDLMLYRVGFAGAILVPQVMAGFAGGLVAWLVRRGVEMLRGG